MTQVFDGDVYDQANIHKDDEKLFAEFFTEAVQNKFKSDQEGRPVYDEVVMIRILTPGSRDVMVTKATEHYKMRFPRQWQRFEMKHKQVVDGTPLDQVPFLTVGQIAELKGLNVFSLEQLANLSDGVAQKVMGFHDLKRRAQAFLAAAKDAAPLTQLQAELEQRDNVISLLKSQVEELSARVAELSKTTPPPPPKVTRTASA